MSEMWLIRFIYLVRVLEPVCPSFPTPKILTPFCSPLQIFSATMPAQPVQPFRFFDLPSELRLLVHEFLPRYITYAKVDVTCHLQSWLLMNGDRPPKTPITFVERRASTSVLRTCRLINVEVSTIVHHNIENFILGQTPRMVCDIDHTARAIQCIMHEVVRETQKLRTKSHGSNGSAMAKVLHGGVKTRSPHKKILRRVRRKYPADLHGARERVGFAAKSDPKKVAAFINVAARQLLYSQLRQPDVSSPVWELVCCYESGYDYLDQLGYFVSNLGRGNVPERCARYGIKLSLEGSIPVAFGATGIIRRGIVPQLHAEEASDVRRELEDDGFRVGWDGEDDEDDKVEEVAELERSTTPMVVLDEMSNETWEQDWVASL